MTARNPFRHHLWPTWALLGAGCLASVAAQPAAETQVRAIRAEYQRVSAATAAARHKDPHAGLFCTEITVNSLQAPWRAVGTFSRRVVFWFDDQPGFAEAEGRPGLAVLRKVEVRTVSAARTEYEEHLFDQGELLFCLLQPEPGTGQPVERFYFDRGRLIRHLSDGPTTGDPPRTEEALAQAAHWQTLFLATCR